MKKISLMLMAFGLVATSCTKSEFDYVYGEDPHADFAKQFAQTFGDIDPNHDWGFGSSLMRGAAMRAASTWDGNHTCAVSNWDDVLTFEKPADAVDLTNEKLLFPDGNNLSNDFANVTEWYVPAEHNGSLSLHNMNLKGNVYVLGKLTDLQSVSCNGVTFYIAKDATMKYTISTGGRQNIVNAGNLEVAKWSNVGELYNGGTLTVTATDVENDAKIYSNGEATIEFPYGGDLKATCDIHGTINVTGNLKIQNGTSKYICGIKATGTVENVDGPFYTSYVEADKFTVDGNKTYLLPGGHIKANTVHVYNSGCSIEAAPGYTALIEANDFIFANDNDFDRTVTDNVYFQISGSVDVSGVTNGNLKEKKKFDNAEAYIAANGNPNDKLNAGTATGSPACGEAWTVGTTPEEGVIRIIAEDLGGETSDFDYNDVVFDAYIKDGKAHITLQAAGGTLPLYVAGKEVHAMFGVSQTTMVNTDAEGGVKKDPVSYEVEVNYESVKDIPVVVYRKDGTELELNVTKGGAAEKIAVKPTYQWTTERQEIWTKYPKFNEYVGDKDVTWY